LTSAAVIILVGVMYGVIGVATAALAAPGHVRGWRLAAWVVSAVLYAAHIGYEHYRRHSAPRLTALHVAGAAALGGFVVASAANVHSLFAATGAPLSRRLVALVAFPAITALPAFLVALVVAVVLARLSRRS
jgi:hypothetical protein